MMKLQTGKFVNLVASVNRETGQGKILYVNPSTVATTADVTGRALGATPSLFDAFEVTIQDAAGAELRRFQPTIQMSTCDDGEAPKTALISEDIPVLDGMKRIVLLHNGAEVSRFEAGTSRPVVELVSGMTPLTMGTPMPARTHRRALSTAAPVVPVGGVSYTVQVRPQGTSAWQTIAVGQKTPDTELDRNQFPGVKAATVRVLRSTGFDDEVLSEQEIDLDY